MDSSSITGEKDDIHFGNDCRSSGRRSIDCDACAAEVRRLAERLDYHTVAKSHQVEVK